VAVAVVMCGQGFLRVRRPCEWKRHRQTWWYSRLTPRRTMAGRK